MAPSFNNTIQRLHLERELNDSPLMKIVTDDSRKAVVSALSHMWHIGAAKKASSVRSILATLEANVNNEKLSDKDFRSFTQTIIDSLKEECHQDNC